LYVGDVLSSSGDDYQGIKNDAISCVLRGGFCLVVDFDRGCDGGGLLGGAGFVVRYGVIMLLNSAIADWRRDKSNFCVVLEQSDQLERD
jgi:hypothetical protein